MAIAFKAAGSGAGTETTSSPLNIPCPPTVDVNDILIAHVIHLNNTTAPATPSGWSLLYGPAGLGTGTPTGRAWVFGKLALGNEDGTNVNFGTTGGTSGRYGRIYSFSGYVSGSITGVVPSASFADNASETDPSALNVTTTRQGALAVALVAQDDNNAIEAFSGETGGNWTEAIAEYIDANWGAQGAMCQIQTATPTADPGTISGGTFNTADDENSTIVFEIRPSSSLTFSVGQATETETTRAIRSPLKVNLALEVETAPAITRRKARIASQALETELGQATTERKIRSLGPGREFENGLATARRKAKAITVSVETEAPQATNERKGRVLGAAGESEVAESATRRKLRALSVSLEVEAGLATFERKVRALVTAIEVEQANDARPPGLFGQAVEAETAAPITTKRFYVTGQAVESEAAQAATKRNVKIVRLAVERENVIPFISEATFHVACTRIEPRYAITGLKTVRISVKVEKRHLVGSLSVPSFVVNLRRES